MIVISAREDSLIYLIHADSVFLGRLDLPGSRGAGIGPDDAVPEIGGGTEDGQRVLGRVVAAGDGCRDEARPQFGEEEAERRGRVQRRRVGHGQGAGLERGHGRSQR